MANRNLGYDGKVAYRAGSVINSDGHGFEKQTDAWQAEAECGCGIDCCNRELVLTDQTTGVVNSLYFDDGGLFTRNHATGVVSQVTLTPVG